VKKPLMNVIRLKLKEHKGEERIFVEFLYSKKINDAVRQVPGAKWSQSKRHWYLPAEKNSVLLLEQKIKSLAIPDISILKKQLEEKKKIKEVATYSLARAAKNNSGLSAPLATVNYKSKQIQSVNARVIPAMQQHLKLKAYSSSTIKTYLNEMAQLLQALRDIPADELKPEHLKRYLVYCYEKLQLKENTLHSRINALKFYYEQVLKREKFFWDIPRPKNL